MSHSDAMILLFLIAALSNRTHAACSLEGRNVLCQADFNTAECDWDDGDCCEATCTPHYAYPSRECGVTTLFDCKNPSFDPTEATLSPTPSPTCTVIANDSTSVIGNGICDNEFNNAACQYDGGDCCSGSCNVSIHAPVHLCQNFDNCEDPAYKVLPNTSFYEELSGIGGTYKDISANVLCMDHLHGDKFVPVGNWKLSGDQAFTFDIEQAGGNQGVPSDYYEYCLVNLTKSTCEAQEFVSGDGFHVLTYCCALDIWVIGENTYEEEEGAPTFVWYAVSESGTVDGLEEWYGDAYNKWSADDYKTFGSVRIFAGGCETTGLIMVAVLFVIFIGILIWFCYKFGIRNCGSVLDAFEKQAARIELIIIGICFGDSFISSIFISIPLPMAVVSKGIVVMFFTFISLLLFGVRMYITKAHILESESIGSLSDFTFDLGLGILLIFLYTDVTGEMTDGFNFFVLLILLGTYAGIVEEFLQLLSHCKNEKVQNAIGCYLDQSGRILSTVNMFILFMFSVTRNGNVGTEWAVFLSIWSGIMFFATVYSWYAYVGCCGRGGHKKPREKGGDDKDDEEAANSTGDKAEDGGEDKAEDGGANKAEDGDEKAVDKDDPEDGDDGRAETNI
eukprot:1101047_1